MSVPGTVFGEPILGFFVSLNQDSEQLPAELWFTVIYRDELAEVEPLCLNLTGSIMDAIAGGLAKLKRTTLTMESEQKSLVLDRLQSRYVRFRDDLAGMISLTLYLAAENREITSASGQQPQNPKPTKTKQGPRLFPPSQPQQWEVGWRLGASLRAAHQTQEENESASELQRAKPRAHIRRAHWHSFWVGSRLSPDRALRVKWLPPTAVNLGVGEDLPITIHQKTIL